VTRIGIVGGGQLARMLALAGRERDVECVCLEPNPDPVRGVAQIIEAPYADPKGLQQLGGTQVVTFEFENVPPPALDYLETLPNVLPRPRALRVSQDRATEKELFLKLGMPTTPFAPVNNLEELKQAIDKLGLPGILKTRRMGYDGKGQTRLSEGDSLPTELAEPCIYERLVDFERELSLLCVRSLQGEVDFYPLVENQHRHGILRRSSWVEPAPELVQQARQMGLSLLEELDYVGVLALEMFQVENELVCNEFAPRVHNSGHWTIEGAMTSQFDNHLRAVLGQPLGSCAPLSPAAMLNCLGTLPDANRVLAVPGAHLHVYGKENRPGRKVGHITVVASEPDVLDQRLSLLEELL
jgi:5-(carboxyamino)imidazole ribonucleotide synthase